VPVALVPIIAARSARCATGWAAGTPYGYFPTLGTSKWNSDYVPEAGAEATSWTITLVDNGGGTFTATISAYYLS
jgi:hypothetical protein